MSGKALHPIHHSVRRVIRNQRLRPSGMAKIEVSPEQSEMLERIALEIFTDMTNAGATLQETLAAIYFSGLVHAEEIIRERNNTN